MKNCNTCGETKPLDEYDKSKGSRDGYRNKCKACRATYYRDRYQSDHERSKVVAKVKAHKRRKHYTYGDFTAADWDRLVEAYGPVCMKCGSKDNLSLDHVVPLSLYGEHSIKNAQILCLDCNKQKGNRSCADYRPYLAFEEQDWQKHEVPVGLNPLALVAG